MTGAAHPTARATIEAAFVALKGVEGATVKLAGETIPVGITKLITVDLIVARDAPDFEGDGHLTDVQVNTFAPTVTEALALADAAETVLDPLGYSRGISRRTPANTGATLTGISTDYRR